MGYDGMKLHLLQTSKHGSKTSFFVSCFFLLSHHNRKYLKKKLHILCFSLLWSHHVCAGIQSISISLWSQLGIHHESITNSVNYISFLLSRPIKIISLQEKRFSYNWKIRRKIVLKMPQRYNNKKHDKKLPVLNKIRAR